MIDQALEFVCKEVEAYLTLQTGDSVQLATLHKLEEASNLQGVQISLVNIGEEPSLRNTSQWARNAAGQLESKQPPAYLNTWLMFTFKTSDYATSLQYLSQTIEQFQLRRFLDESNQMSAITFPEGLERLVFDMYSLDFEQLNHLWGILGTSYHPSVLYRMRLVKVQANVATQGPEITHLEVNTRFKRP